MTLKITLKPNERMIVGRAVLRNGNTKCHLMVENSVPILREKDIIGEKQADAPARRIYYIIQLMYIDEENLKDYHKTYWSLVHDFIKAVPSTTGIIDQINKNILNEKYYHALKLTKKLLKYEQELLNQYSELTENPL
jgi:flagellar biosynthesis repressor protein FlbT